MVNNGPDTPQVGEAASRSFESVLQIIAGNVKELRGRRRMTQEELAAKADTVRSTVERLERGLGCSLKNLINIADALGVSPADLFITKADEERMSFLQLKVMERLAELMQLKR